MYRENRLWEEFEHVRRARRTEHLIPCNDEQSRDTATDCAGAACKKHSLTHQPIEPPVEYACWSQTLALDGDTGPTTSNVPMAMPAPATQLAAGPNWSVNAPSAAANPMPM
jgi:hypothetical protein